MTNMRRLAKILDRLPVGLLLIVLIAASYMPVRELGYAYDDGQYVLGAPQISHGLNLPDIKWALTATHASNWHPLTWISYMVDTQIAGMKPGQFHTTNLLLHIACALLLFFVLNRLTKSAWKSLFVAALVGVHPLHVESVAWIAERKDELSALFWFLTFWAYIRYTERRTITRYLPALLFFTLGLMSKPMLVTLPFTLLLLDYWPLGRLSGENRVPIRTLIVEKIPLFLLSAASCIVTYVVQKAGGAFGTVSYYPLHIRLMNALNSYVMYIWKMVWPMDLAVCYPHPGFNLPIWKVIAAGVFLLAVTALVIRARTKRPYLVFGWLWYLITLIPVIGIVQVGNQAMADRYTYVPLIGLFVMIAWGVPDMLKRDNGCARPFAPGLSLVAALLVLALAGLTRIQVGYWMDNYTLFKHASEAVDGNAEAYSNYGAALRIMGDNAGALEQYKKAAAIDPNVPIIHANLGGAYHELGRDNEALPEYQKAVKQNPNDASLYTNLAVVQATLGKLKDARFSFDKALKLNPKYAEAHNEYGNFLSSTGRSKEALVQYNAAIAINPTFTDAYYNKGVALHTIGRFNEAVDAYRKVVRLNPEYESAHNNLSIALFMVGRYKESWAEVHKVLNLDGSPNPDFLLALSQKMHDPQGK